MVIKVGPVTRAETGHSTPKPLDGSAVSEADLFFRILLGSEWIVSSSDYSCPRVVILD